MVETIQYEDHSNDPETIAMPVSAEDAAALHVILANFVEMASEMELEPDIPNREKLIEVNELLLDRARVMLKEVKEIHQYFSEEEKKVVKIIIPKTIWPNVTSVS